MPSSLPVATYSSLKKAISFRNVCKQYDHMRTQQHTHLSIVMSMQSLVHAREYVVVIGCQRAIASGRGRRVCCGGGVQRGGRLAVHVILPAMHMPNEISDSIHIATTSQVKYHCGMILPSDSDEIVGTPSNA
jgi:hypothetical protein